MAEVIDGSAFLSSAPKPKVIDGSSFLSRGYEVGRLSFAENEPILGQVCKRVQFNTALVASFTGATRVLLGIERSDQSDSLLSTKAVASAHSITTTSMVICIQPLAKLSKSPSLNVNWFVLERNQTWVQTRDIYGASTAPNFLQASCQNAYDNRTLVGLDGDEVLLPVLKDVEQVSNGSTESQSSSLVLWTEFEGAEHIDICMLQSLEAGPASERAGMSFFAVQQSHHSSTGSLPVPPWSPGLYCTTVLHEHATRPYVFVAVQHPKAHGNSNSNDAAVVWVRDVDMSSFTVCAEEVRNFWDGDQGLYSEATLHWVAISGVMQ